MKDFISAKERLAPNFRNAFIKKVNHILGACFLITILSMQICTELETKNGTTATSR